ncbi:MAG: biotin--[acetyl-CoA-carboxylase] ligase [Candidatus Hodarchaeales archaeon]
MIHYSRDILQRDLSRTINQLSVIKHLTVFDVITSTHLYARENHTKLEDGTLILALEQTGGVGRGSNRWISSHGGLYLTIVLKSENGFVKTFPYIAMLSLSILSSLDSFNISCQIKWPNDIYYGNRKIAGILASGITANKGTNTLILSAGVNLNNSPSNYPDIAANAISCRDIKGKEVDFSEFIRIIISNLDNHLTIEDYSGIFSKYNRFLGFKNQTVNIETGNGIVSGKISKVSNEGVFLEIGKEKILVEYI